MKTFPRLMSQCLFVAVLSIVQASFAADRWGLERGTPDLQSAGPLAIGPDDILFVGDTKAAAIFAIATGTSGKDAASAEINIENPRQKIRDTLHADDVVINDLAANPRTGRVFVSLTVVTGDGLTAPAIVEIDSSGQFKELKLTDVRFAKATLSNAPEDKVTGSGRRQRNQRDQAITDIAFYEGRVLVSGLRSGESPSSVRELNFPFSPSDRGFGIEIYHAAHGRSENSAAPLTFVTLMIDGEPNLLAAYVCTPLVKIPLKELAAERDRIQATTVAELGNRNRPLDMISYSQDGQDYLLLSNDARGVMKISTSGLSENKGLTDPVRGGGTAGQTYETIDALQGVVQMDKFSDSQAVVLIEDDGQLNLKTVPLP